MKKFPKPLSFVTYGYAPGYRDLTLHLADTSRCEYELRLEPRQVQLIIYACADVAKQIGSPHPPIDWEKWPSVIHWPQVTTWMAGSSAAPPADNHINALDCEAMEAARTEIATRGIWWAADEIVRLRRTLAAKSHTQTESAGHARG